MRERDWLWLGLAAIGLYLLTRPSALPTVAIPGGGFTGVGTLPPGLPSGAARIRAALDGFVSEPTLQSRQIGVGYLALPGEYPTRLSEFDMTGGGDDFIDVGVLPSRTTVPLYSDELPE